MSGAFLWDDKIKGADITAPRALTPSLPLSNLLDPQPRRRTRFTPATVGSGVNIVIDLGEDALVECVALISTTIAAGALVQSFGRVDDPSTGTIVWNTGVIAAETSAEANGNVVLLPATPVAARYLWVAVVPNAPFVDIGRIVAGPLWRIARPVGYGVTEGRLILDTRERNALTGAEFTVPAVQNPRVSDFTLPIMPTTEARGQHRQILATLGAAGDALWIPNTTDGMAERNLRSLWGGIAEPGGATVATRTALNVHARTFRMVERL